MSSPSDPDPDAVPGGAPQEEPASEPPRYPAPGYGAGPGGVHGPAGGRPPQVLGAAVLGFVVAFFLLLGALALVAAASLFGAVSAVFAVLYLGLAALNVVGGVRALQGRGSGQLKVAGMITAGLGVLSLVTSLIQGRFDYSTLVSILIGVGIVFLLSQPVSRQWFAARGAR